MKPVEFSRQVDYNTYIKLVLQLIFESAYTLAFYFAGFFSLYLVYVVFDIPKEDSIIILLVILIAMLVYPMRIYSRAKKRFTSTPSASEESFWRLDDSGIEIKSRSSSSYKGWDMVVKITENKNWIFIWYNNAQFTFFAKTSISKEELQEIKKIVLVNRKKQAA